MSGNKIIWIFIALILLLCFTGNLNAQKILFKSNFSDLKENWEIVDDPETKRGPGNWRFGLTELSGFSNRENIMATALLAGEKTWKNYTVKTSLHMAAVQGYLVGIICGYQDPEHFFIVGYNFYKRRFEFMVRTTGGFELLAFHKVDFLPGVDIPIRLDFGGDRICFSANERVIFDINDGRYTQGGFGLGISGLQGSRVLFGPVRVFSLDSSSLPSRDKQDLLALHRGAQIVSGIEKNAFKVVIDHNFYMDKDEVHPGSSMSINIQKTPLPLEGIYVFPQEKPVEIHSIGLQLEGRYFPGEIEFLVSEQNQDEMFESLGKFQIKPEKKSYQEYKFEGIKAKYLKIRILSSVNENYVQINEIFVKGFHEGSPQTTGSTSGLSAGPPGKIMFEDDFSSGNLDHWQIWNDPDANDEDSQWAVVLSEFSDIYNAFDHPATFLLTGDQGWTGYSLLTNLYAVRSDGNLSGFVFGYKDSDNYYMAGYNFQKNRFELGRHTPQGFEILAFAAVVCPRKQWFPLKLDSGRHRILFRFDNKIIFDLNVENPVSGKVGLGTSALNVGVINFDKYQVVSIEETSLPDRELQDILASRRGAAVIYRETLPKGDKFDDLIDHLLFQDDNCASTYDVDYSRDSLPQEAVFCFPQGRFVEIHRIGFKLRSRRFPKEINFWVSNHTPKSEFSPLETISIQPERDSYQEFAVPPTRAKYLKMQISQGADAKKLEIHEMFVKGYFKELSIRQPGEETLGEVQIQEKEPNNSLEQAQALPLSAFLGGEAAREDIDYYKIALKNQPGNTLTIYINNLGMMRPGYSLMTSESIKIDPIREISVANNTEVTYQLAQDDYFLRIDRPESYLTIVFDDSSSMSKSVGIVKRILGSYLDNLGQGLNLQLMKYTSEPHFLSGFTHDAPLLKQALEKEVKGGGGTDTFKGLGAAVRSVQAQPGNRAVLAIFDVVDCSGSTCLQNYIDLWDAILDSGISFSTIAVQRRWDKATSYFGNTRQRIFKEIAFASSGQYYYSPTPDKVEESADQIFKQLTAPVAYRLKAEWIQTEQKPGLVEVRFEKGAEKKAAKNVELILDASNSMWGQIQGKAKIVIAKEVLNQIINGLPDEMNVGLRLYGHRYNLKNSRACQDTELVAPIGPINKKQLVEAVNKITPRGKTPLVHSVLEGIKDFKELKGGTIVLISDGVESCDGDINSIAMALQGAGLDLQVNIVGFDIKEVDARKQLEAIAASTGGIYLDAKDSEQLLDSLEQTLQVEFVLLDEQGEIKARGAVGGEPVEIIEGTYTLKLLLQPESLEQSVTISPAKKAVLTLKKEADKWILVK